MRPSARSRTVPHVRVAAALAGALSLAATALSGCGDVGYADAAPVPTSPPASDPAGPDPEPPAPGDDRSALAVGEAEGVGQVTVDAAGFTLYRFDSDTADPPASACGGDCARAWPPVTVEDAADLAATGIDADLLGTLTRDDGSLQVTLAGWPLYRYAQDAAPGDALGHGVGGTWFAARPTGERATAAEPEEPAGATSDGYDY
jgi:predicted lipoprotein with Yx(FWY)xxD motif